MHFGSALRAFPLLAFSPLLPPAPGPLKPQEPLVWEALRSKPSPSLSCSTGSSAGQDPGGQVDRGRDTVSGLTSCSYYPSKWLKSRVLLSFCFRWLLWHLASHCSLTGLSSWHSPPRGNSRSQDVSISVLSEACVSQVTVKQKKSRKCAETLIATPQNSAEDIHSFFQDIPSSRAQLHVLNLTARESGKGVSLCPQEKKMGFCEPWASFCL